MIRCIRRCILRRRTRATMRSALALMAYGRMKQRYDAAMQDYIHAPTHGEARLHLTQAWLLLDRCNAIARTLVTRPPPSRLKPSKPPT